MHACMDVCMYVCIMCINHCQSTFKCQSCHGSCCLSQQPVKSFDLILICPSNSSFHLHAVFWNIKQIRIAALWVSLSVWTCLNIKINSYQYNSYLVRSIWNWDFYSEPKLKLVQIWHPQWKMSLCFCPSTMLEKGVQKAFKWRWNGVQIAFKTVRWVCPRNFRFRDMHPCNNI
jgi:hypothetical protein